MNQAATLRTLQRRITEMQPLRMGDGVLPTAAALRPLLPAGALSKGVATSVQGSRQLALALLAEVSARGAWCGAIGLTDFGFEAAADLGIALDRFVVAPSPDRHALHLASMLSEVLSAIVLHAPAAASPDEAERLAARLRAHGTALIVLGDWPRSETSLRVTASQWSGLGPGHGMIDGQALTVRSIDRRGSLQHTVRFAEGRLVAPRDSAVARTEQRPAPLRAVSS